MMVRWEGQVPPDWASWREAVRRGLGEDATFYWIRFYREPGGWRFDLERRDEEGFQRAEESVALQVYEALVEGGQPVDPGWMPFEEFPPAPTPPETRPAAEPAPAETRTEAEPPPPSGPSPPVAADRRAAWRRLLPAVVYGPAVLLVALALWLSRDRLRLRPEPSLAPSPVATASADALAAQKRLQELEAVVAQLQREREEAPRRDGGPPARPPVPRAAPAPKPGPTPPQATPTPASLPAPAPSPAEPTVADPAPAAATDALPPPATPQRGRLVELGDPGVSPPVLVTQGRARYPPRALERRLSGTVWVRALVDETGAVAEVALVRASVRGVGFEDEAMRHVRTRRYTPASQQGVPARVWVPIAVEFRLP